MSIFALKCPIFVAGNALKGGFIRAHDLFHINTSEKISQSKLEMLLPLTCNQESFGGSTMAARNFGTPGVSNLTIIRSFKAFSQSLPHLFDSTNFMCENDLSFMTDVGGKQNNFNV